MKKIGLILILLTIISKFLGFFREVLVSFYYGASITSDLYFIAILIPNTIFALISAGLIANFIPILTKIGLENAKLYNNFAVSTLNFTLIISTIFISIFYIFDTHIVKVFVSGFDENQISLASSYTKITILSIYFLSIQLILSNYLNTKNKFYINVLASIPFNLVIMLSVVISAKTSEIILAYGFLSATLLQALLNFVFSIKSNLKYSFTLNIDKHLKKLILLSLPIILGITVNQINVIIDRSIASNILVGGISSLTYSSNLTAFIIAVFVMTASTLVFPKISKLIEQKKIKEFVNTVEETVVVMIIILIPITTIFILNSTKIIQLVYGRGSFDAQDIKITSATLAFYSIGLLGIAIRELLSKAFYAMNEVRIPVKNGMYAVLLNILLNFSLTPFFGINALAFSTSASALIASVLLIKNFKKELNIFNIIRIVKYLIFCILYFLLIFGIYIMLNNSYSIGFYIMQLLALSVYLYIFMRKYQILNSLKRKMSKNGGSNGEFKR